MTKGSIERGDINPLRTTVEGEVFLHKEIWCVVQRQLANAEATPKGSFYDDLAAMVFTSHALEGYLNFLGERLDATFWSKERRHFRSTGFAGKAAKVFELCGLSEPDKAARPYSSVWLLKELRDDIAHAKPIRFKIDKEHGHNDMPDFTGYNPLTEIVSHTTALRCADDVQEIIHMMHDAAKPHITDDFWFGDEALVGIMGHRSHFTRAK